MKYFYTEKLKNSVIQLDDIVNILEGTAPCSQCRSNKLTIFFSDNFKNELILCYILEMVQRILHSVRLV